MAKKKQESMFVPAVTLVLGGIILLIWWILERLH
jgi:hypothetical protein